MNGVVQLLTRFGSARLAAMGAVTLALIGFFAFVILRVSQPAMGVLFAELTPADAGAVTRDLDTRAVKYETRDDGGTVLVPRSEIGRLRMDLAQKGLPAGGGVGYEIFDKGDAFSTTSFVQNVNLARALEGELSRSIRTIGRVQAARVHLALPEKRLFERDREPPRASIVLKLRGELGGDQVAAIRHLVASGVEGLVPENISIIDERGRLLASGAGAGGAAGEGAVTGANAEEKRVALERRLRGQVEEIVAGIVGSGRSRVQVAAEFDPTRIESRSESFDPESRVVRSTQTRGENSATQGGDNQVTVGNELPGARDAAEKAQPRDTANKTEETVNYEISKTTRTEVQGAGRLKRLSVAVLVDGVRSRAQNGETAYQPRSKEDLDRIAALVRTAVGFDKARGDQVEVVNLPFAEPPALPEAEATSLMSSILHPTKEDAMRWAELAIIALLTLLVLMLVVRPLVRRILTPDLIAAGGAIALPGRGEAVAALADIDGRIALPEPGSLGSIATDQMNRLSEVAKSNPRQAAAVLRGWMTEE